MSRPIFTIPADMNPPETQWTINDNPEPSNDITVPEKFQPVFEPHRYKVYWGGRGAGKSVSFARALIAIAHTQKKLILCTREFQNSIADSVHRVLAKSIDDMNLTPWFDVLKSTIISKVTGSQFLFKGLAHSIQEIKSTEGVDICWVEEGQAVSKESWLVLDPTIRAEGSEIWVSFNPDQERDATYENFITSPPPNAVVIKVNWYDNPWFPKELEIQRQRMLRIDPASYDWVWNGFPRSNTASTIFRGKYSIETFDEPPPQTQFYHGADFGFADDPSTLIRCWIRPCNDGTDDQDLMVDREAYGHHIEIDHLPAFYDATVETARDWPIFADNSRPETISYLCRQGYNMMPCTKWAGSVEDGITHLKGFRKIIVHERCPQTAQEMRLYSYKVDPKSLLVLPLVVDKWNHGIDALRYSLDSFIHSRGNLGVWQKLGYTAGASPAELQYPLSR